MYWRISWSKLRKELPAPEIMMVGEMMPPITARKSTVKKGWDGCKYQKWSCTYAGDPSKWWPELGFRHLDRRTESCLLCDGRRGYEACREHGSHSRRSSHLWLTFCALYGPILCWVVEQACTILGLGRYFQSLYHHPSTFGPKRSYCCYCVEKTCVCKSEWCWKKKRVALDPSLYMFFDGLIVYLLCPNETSN